MSRWVTFTVTDTGTEFVNQIAALTGSDSGRGGLVTLKDSGWVLSCLRLPPARNHRPTVRDDRLVGLRFVSRAQGDFVRKRMDQCTGAEILEETLRQLRFDKQLDAIMASSICVPC